MHSFQWFINNANEIHNFKYDYSSVNFINMTTKVSVRCPFHGEFLITPKKHIHGKRGCPRCLKETKNKSEKFVNSAHERFGDKYSFPNINTEYKNSHSKITIKCNSCGSVFKKTACDFMTSKFGGCNCYGNRENFISYEELKDINKKYKIAVFEGLKHKSKSKITVICNDCGSQIKTTPKSIINGKNICKKCNGKENNKTIPIEEIKNKMSILFPTIDVDYNGYINTNSNLSCRCKQHGHIFKRTINSFFYRINKEKPCPICNRLKISNERVKTTKEFISDVENVYGVGRYTVIGEYKRSNKPITIKCNKCGKTFDIEANSFLSGHGCPYHNNNASKLEKEVLKFVKEQCGKDCVVEHNNKKILNGNELDIYIPSKNIAIEFDGLFWHNENNKPFDYHLKKTENCQKKGIRLIHIFEDEWVYKKGIVKSMLNNILYNSKNHIFCRKTEIKHVESSECKKFLEENHLQGWCPSSIKIGLYYNEELVSIMTFGKSRHFIGNGKCEYELLRFCNKIGTIVVGGASRLFKFFVKEYNPSEVVSYADRRWSVGNLYYKLGFSFSHNSKPNYFYIIKDKRKNRFNFRKSVLIKKYGCDKNMSERKFCQMKKWFRIYDCGTMCFKWNK